jgi:hypothetical protein
MRLWAMPWSALGARALNRLSVHSGRLLRFASLARAAS